MSSAMCCVLIVVGCSLRYFGMCCSLVFAVCCLIRWLLFVDCCLSSVDCSVLLVSSFGVLAVFCLLFVVVRRCPLPFMARCALLFVRCVFCVLRFVGCVSSTLGVDCLCACCGWLFDVSCFCVGLSFDVNDVVWSLLIVECWCVVNSLCCCSFVVVVVGSCLLCACVVVCMLVSCCLFFCRWCHCLDVVCCLSYVVCCGIVAVCCALLVLVLVVRCVLAGCCWCVFP